MIYKENEFDKFLKELEEGSQPFWANIAEAIGVDQETIARWKELPEAQIAMKRGIQNTLREMEGAGRKDWRMWEQRLKMFGINPPQKVEGSLRVDDRKKILAKYMGDDPSDNPQ